MTTHHAIVTKLQTLFAPPTYRLLIVATADLETFHTAQECADWIAEHLPGETVEWRIG